MTLLQSRVVYRKDLRMMSHLASIKTEPPDIMHLFRSFIAHKLIYGENGNKGENT